MARINGVEPHEASLFTRFVYWLARRKIGKMAGKNQIVEPLKVTAHHPRLFRGYGQMEMAQDARPNFAHAVESVGIDQDGDVDWLPVLNRYRLCRGQKPGPHRGAVARPADFVSTDAFSDLEKLVLRYTSAMTQTPNYRIYVIQHTGPRWPCSPPPGSIKA